MAIDRWITNLEAEETMEQAVSMAKTVLAQAKTGEQKRKAEALYAQAKFKQAYTGLTSESHWVSSRAHLKPFAA